MRRETGEKRGFGKSARLGAYGATVYAVLAVAAMGASPQSVPAPAPAASDEAAQETRLEALSAELGKLGSRLEKELDVAAFAKVAAERWNLDDQAARRVREILARYREAHCAENPDEECEEVLEDLTEEAVELLGEERGREIGAWLREKDQGLRELAARMEGLGAEIAALARRRALEAMSKDHEARKLAERAQREAYKSLHDVLEGLHLDVDHDLRLDLDDLHVRVRDAVEQAKRAQDEMARRLHREALQRPSPTHRAQPLPDEHRARDHEALQRALREAQRYHEAAKTQEGRILHEQIQECYQEALKRLQDDAVKRALEESAGRIREQMEAARKAQEEWGRRLREQLQDKRLSEAIERARELESSERDRARSRRRSESEELTRSREEIEQLRRRVKELEEQIEKLRSGQRVRERSV
jgi:hypothetical protein